MCSAIGTFLNIFILCIVYLSIYNRHIAHNSVNAIWQILKK